MKFSRKMQLMMILKSPKKPGLLCFFEKHIFGKTTGDMTSPSLLGLIIILDNRLSFSHLEVLFSKAYKTIGLLRKLQCLIPRYTLSTMY